MILGDKRLFLLNLYNYFHKLCFNFRKLKNISNELQNTINVLKTTSIKPETKSTAVLTDVSGIHLVSY